MALLPALLHPKHIFGFRSSVVDNLCFMSEQALVYLAGSVAVLYNTDQNSQRFVSNVGRQKDVHVMQISPNHQYLAVGERVEDKIHPGVSVYDLNTLKKCKTLQGSTVKLQQLLKEGATDPLQFVSLTFSHDSKFLVGQMALPDWTLFLWEWETNRLIATLPLLEHLPEVAPVHQVTFHPHDDAQISVVADGGWFLLRLEEGNNLKVVGEQRRDTSTSGLYRCHAWVSDTRILIGSDQGRLLLIEGNDIHQQFNIIKAGADDLSTAFDPLKEEMGSPPLEDNDVTKLVVFSKGFVCSCNSDVVYLFERYAGGRVYRQAAAIKLPNSEESTDHKGLGWNKITCLTLSPSEDIVAVATEIGRIYTFTLTSVDINKSLGPTFEHMTPNFHSGALRDIDTCLRKPIAVTCGTDRAIAVWNYTTYQQQLFKYLDEDVLSVALHPTGLYLLVGCMTKLRLMGLMIDDFRIIHEFSIKECQGCAFSHGGHLIAAIQGNLITVFSTVTFDIMANLKGHVGKVVSIAWTYDDLKLVSCGVDGAIYEWDVYSGKRTNEVTIKSSCCNSVGVARDNCTVFTVGSDVTVREIADSQILGDVALTSSSPLTSIATLHCGKALFTSSSQGVIYVVPVPLTNQEDWHEFQPISMDIVKMKSTQDDKCLLTVSNDGTLGVWKIMDKDGRPFQSDEDLPFLEEILITRADLEEKNLAISELGQQMRDIKTETEYQRRVKEAEHTEIMKNQAETFQNQINALNTELRKLKTENEQLVGKYEKALKEVKESHLQHIEKMNWETHQKLMYEYEKHHELQMENQKTQQEFQKKFEQLKEDKIQAIREIEAECLVQLKESQEQLQTARDELNVARQKCEEMISLIEDDVDQEVANLKKNYEKIILDEKEISKQVKAEIGILKKKLMSMQREVDDQHQEIRHLNSEQHMLKNSIKGLHKDIQNLKNEVGDRDDQLLLKEQKIYEMKQRYADLEKFKLLLELKIDEMNREMEPKEHKMKMMEKQRNEDRNELLCTKQVNKNTELMNERLRQRLHFTNTSLHSQEQKVKQLETVLKNVKWDLGVCASIFQDSKKLKQHIITVCRKYQISSE